MFVLNIISEALLYLCFSVLLGSFILHLVPKTARPSIKVPKGILLAAALGVALLSFVPVLKIILYLYKDLGLGLTIQSVLTNFEVGKSWISTGVISFILFIYLIPIKLERKPHFSITGLIFTLALIAALGWSSHASSLSKWPGFFIHTAHFLAVSTWIGILIAVSWFSKNHDNWLKFLKWFSPIAIICLLTIIITGISLMTFVMDLSDYANTWPLSYDQALLLKHLAIVPLLVFAFINSVLIRNKLSKGVPFNPIPWMRLESILVLIIFAITGALGQESPPHDIKTTIKAEGASKLFSLSHQGGLTFPLHFSPGIASQSLMVWAVFFLILMILTFIKKAPKMFSLVLSLLFIVIGYLALMLSV
ncbi:copper resistance D family protein [Neobacillus sp. NRS-1170]|uniref:copper resistance D family protein n=1 Tax=Neobacillus sp. NRS-1170 TaxID=3233898 RepID=UPI003D2680D6